MYNLAEDPYASIVELSKAFRDKKILPSQVMAAQLARIEALEPKLGSFQAVYSETALNAAKAADDDFANDRSRGPFHGIPFALKDLYELEGHITTCGSYEMLERVSQKTGTVTRRLLEGGGIVIGKTKSVEFGLGAWGTNLHMGTPWNPWDLENQRVPGGSSSGSGVAVASGMAMCATGSDTGGSVRLPAAYCGLAGLKVSKKCIPTDGIMTLSKTLDTPGPITRSTADLALMFSIMLGLDGPHIETDISHGSGLFGVEMEIFKGLKLGVLDDEERAFCTADVLESFDSALKILSALGADLKVFKSPIAYKEMADLNGAITMYEGYHNHRAYYDDPNKIMDPNVKKRMFTGRALSAQSHAERIEKRQGDQAVFQAAFSGFDALLTPTILQPAIKLSDVDEDKNPGHFTRPFNYIDMCALSLPTAYSAEGLPTSIQIVLPAGREGFAVKMGSALEAALGISVRPKL